MSSMICVDKAWKSSLVRGLAERIASSSFDDDPNAHRMVKKRSRGCDGTSLTSQPRSAQQGCGVLEIGRDFVLLVPARLFARIEDGIFVVLEVVVTVTRRTSRFGSLLLCQLGFERALFLWGCDWCGCRLGVPFVFFRGCVPIALGCGVSRWGNPWLEGLGLRRAQIRLRLRLPICS